ncbi:MAG: NPCBM/NEW2 domain-containing protein [Fibrobacteria bacterium]|nr:NPCBM/NEW2 domain-containing protein [Fibrobacteria bacterium]
MNIFLTYRFFICFLFILLCIGHQSFALHFVAYGDTRSNPSLHTTVLNGISSENPELILNSGDLWNGYEASFNDVVGANANIKTLLETNLYLIAQGNHEDDTQIINHRPSLVRNGSVKYSFTMDNIFFIASAVIPDNEYIEAQLQTQAAKDAAWRIIFFHIPVYSSGGHVMEGIPDFEKLCDQYNVEMVFSGHSHNYDRTYLLYDRQVVTEEKDINHEVKGTFYVVTGGGGAPLYEVTKQWWQDPASVSTLHYCVITTSDVDLNMVVKKPDGTIIDQLSITKALPPYELVTNAENGSITVDPANSPYDADAEVTLTAVADQGFIFRGWSGNISGETNPVTIKMTSPKTINANFSEAGSEEYLSDLPFTTIENGYGPVELDMSNGENASGDGNTLTINGVTYTKGLGVHSDFEAKWILGGVYSDFKADIGLDDETAGTVIFEVYVDGTLKFKSDLKSAGDPAESISIDVSGGNELVLKVTDGGDGMSRDHADWADARLVVKSHVSAVAINTNNIKALPSVMGSRLDLAPYVGLRSVTVYSITGRKMFFEKIGTKRGLLNLRDLNQGQYILKFNFIDGDIHKRMLQLN